VVARNGLANVLRKLNQLDEAEALLSEQLSSNPERRRFDGVVLALIDVKRGLFEKAIRRITDTASSCARKTPKARLLALAASIELRRNKPHEASTLMKNESATSNDEAVRLLAWHVNLATSTEDAAAVASQWTLKLISERAKKVEKSISALLRSGQSLCGNDELFELECDLLAA
jgi:predicted Zn-dependent protease